jgi:hypothetical protein
VTTLVTTVQQVITALKAAGTEDERLIVVVKAVCGLVRKQGLTFATCAAQFATIETSDSSSPLRGAKKM